MKWIKNLETLWEYTHGNLKEQKNTENEKVIEKNNSAITLIALVITIIILLILAGITVAMLMGENGILGRAQTAKEKYETAQNYEEEQIGKINNEVESYVDGGREYTNYSTSEQVVGSWLGETVYGKVVDLGYSFTVENESTSISTSVIQTNIDIPIKAYFYIIGTEENLKVRLPVEAWMENDVFYYRAIRKWYGEPDRHVYLYIEYTK